MSQAEYNNFPPVKEIKYVPSNQENIVEFKPEHEVKRPDTLFLYFVVITGVLPMLVTGASLARTSPAMVKLQSNDTNINPLGRPITTTEISLYMGISQVVSLIGNALLPAVADLIGRKKTVQLIGTLEFLSIIGLAFSNSIWLMIFFFSLIQCFFSAVWSIIPIYITEICEDHNRGRFGCLLSVFLPVGELYSFIIGPEFSLRDLTLLTAAPMIPFLLLFFFAPESPVYYLSKGKDEQCIRALKKLRSNKTSKELDYDLNEIRNSLMLTKKSKEVSLVKFVRSKEGKVSLMLGFLIALIQMLSGVPVVMALLAPIFNESGSNLSGDTIAIIVGVVKIITCVFTTVVVEKVGRRKLMIISSFGTGLAVSILGVFFHFKYVNSPIVLQFQWVPLAAVLVYIICFSLGIGVIPNVLVGELFTIEYRAFGYAFIFTAVTIILAVYSAAYPLIAAAFGTQWCMWIFGAGCFLGAFYTHVLLPETQGKSITEIQEMLKNF